MNKLTNVFLATSLTVACSTIAQASIYGEVFGGLMNQNVEFSLINNETSEEMVLLEREEQSQTLGARLGLNISKYLAIEAGYADNGYIELTPQSEDILAFESTKIRSTSLQFAVKGILPITDYVSLNAKGGWAVWKSWNDNIPRDGSQEAQDSQEEGQDPYFGAGAEINFNEHIALGFEYSQLIMNTTETNEGFNVEEKLTHKVEQVSMSLKLSL